MLLKKIIVVASSSLFLTAFLFSQSLVELAKKERERRAEHEEKKGVIVTNADLYKMKKEVPVSIIEGEISEEEKAPETGPRISVIEERPLYPKYGAEEEKIFKEQKTLFEAKWKRAREYVELLTTKMNYLHQYFFSLDDMLYREKTAQEINEMFFKLPKAHQEEARAKEELEKFLLQARREGIPSGWLR